MPVKTSCPQCKASLSLADRQLGKNVRCKQCQNVFVVKADSEASPTRPQISAPASASVRVPEKSDERDDDPADSRRDDEETESRRRESRPEKRRSPARSKKGMMNWIILGGGLVFVATIVVIVLILTGGPKVASIDDALEAMQSSDAKTRRKGIEWLRKARPSASRFAEVEKALGAALSDPDLNDVAAEAHSNWVANRVKRGPALEADEEISDSSTERLLNWASDNAAHLQLRRNMAMMELARRKEAGVIPLVVPFLSNFFEGDMAVRVLTELGAVAEPDVVKLYNHPDGHTRGRVVAVLKNYGTKIEVIIDQSLADMVHNDMQFRRTAADLFGRLAPKVSRRDAVSRALFDAIRSTDADMQNKARHALKTWGTPEENIDLWLADLRDPALQRRQVAADSLGQAKFLASRHEVVSRALDQALRDRDGDLQAKVLHALKTWGSTLNVPLLAQMLVTHDRGATAVGGCLRLMELLVLIKDPRGAEALTRHFKEFFTGAHARKALLDMGPAAELAVLQFAAAEADAGMLIEACKILEFIGTKQSDQVLRALIQHKDPNVRQTATSALTAILKRT